MAIIGLSGFAGAGKSTVSEYLVRQHGFVRLSFAAAVKDITAAAFAWDRQRLEGATPQDRAWREEPDSFWSERMGKPFTPRYALQYIGTDVFRNHVLPSIWADLVVAKIRGLGPHANVVIDDVRFVNERVALAKEGATFILLRRSEFATPLHQQLWMTARGGASIRDIETGGLHSSEWEWLRDPTVANDREILNHGSYDDLYAAIDEWWYNTRRQDVVRDSVSVS
jgi:hypothetical protein